MEYIKKLNDFSNNKGEKQKIIVIYGPTGSGKTAMSIDIAKKIDTEIISTDSRQIFKSLDIGTGKITKKEMSGIKHHMVDIISADMEYSVGEFKEKSEILIENIISEGKIPILCGGTGLYINSLIYDFNIPKVPADEELRNKLEKQAAEHGNQCIYDQLVELDPVYAAELHPNNLRYVIRALEVKLLTGKSKTEFREEKKLKYDTLFLTPYSGDREELYERINNRVQIMFNEGLIEEIEELLKVYKKSDFGMKTIGYKEVVEYLEGNMTLRECVELVQKHNRNYAKKQLTWFRKYEEINI
ncbi:tRNA (adenosine(37)-N6)-dimethylallyltransferase MiaA [Candidatus Gracilibacteria bacterium 28_42_T64]|nr:tRNA (adenosine(37)-N6)-dimethylallyltransferase MiaA [Candidatus Gracilibacteria bacterium 28_42_T64]